MPYIYLLYIYIYLGYIIEHLTGNRKVLGSIPNGDETFLFSQKKLFKYTWALTDSSSNFKINNYCKFKLLFNLFGLFSTVVIVISIYNNKQRNIVRVIGSRL